MPKQTDAQKIKDLWWGVTINAMLTLFVIVIITTMASHDSPYFQWGPGAKLFYVSVRVDTWSKYIGIQVWIAIQKMVAVYINELTSPILGFSVYNPDQKNITWISKLKLQVLANVMFGCNSLRHSFTIVVSVTQIDFTLCATLSGQLTSVVTIRKLLNRKNFECTEEEEEKLMKDCEQKKDYPIEEVLQRLTSMEEELQKLKEGKGASA